MNTMRIYFADLSAYNNGHLVGVWIEPEDYDDKEDMWEAVRKGLPDAEEIACHDHENAHGLVSEVGNDWEIVLAAADAIHKGDESALACVVYASECGVTAEEARDELHYSGTDPAEIAAQFYEDCHEAASLPTWVSIDWERSARDLLMCCYEVKIDGTTYYFGG